MLHVEGIEGHGACPPDGGLSERDRLTVTEFQAPREPSHMGGVVPDKHDLRPSVFTRGDEAQTRRETGL